MDLENLLLNVSFKKKNKTGELFKYSPLTVLSNSLAEISDISVVRDNDHLYIVDQEELQRILGISGENSNGKQKST